MRTKITLLGVLILSNLNITQAETLGDKQHQPLPALKIPEKPTDVGSRTITKPGKPESEQPPPDVIMQPTLIRTDDHTRSVFLCKFNSFSVCKNSSLE